MPVYRHHPFSRKGTPPAFWLIYVLSVIFNFQTLLTAYGNSTYMEQFALPEVIGALYTIGSALAVFSFLFISRILRKVGNVKLTVGLAITQIIAMIFVGWAFSPATTIIAFVVMLTVNPLIYLSLDIFSESLIGKNESSTGSKRGLVLTLMSLASVCSTLTLSALVGQTDSNLYRIYFAAAGIFSIFVILVLIHFRTFKDPKYKEVQVLSAIRTFWETPDLRFVFLAYFTLQIFFAWMIIYVPLYLATEVGFNWGEIGLIIAVGLSAYVIFEYPVGLIADRFIGEKEMMAIGFVILAVSSSWITFMATAPVMSWMILMFISRVGGSLVEATSESYFFKHTGGSDANIISFFRLTAPLAMILGALVGSVTLLYLPFNLAFVVLGFIMLPGIFFTAQLKDTK